MFLFLTLPTSAQSDNGEVNDSTSVILQPGAWEPGQTGDQVPGGVGYDDPIPQQPSGPLSVTRPLFVGLSGHTLYTFGQFDGYTLYIIREEEVVYAEEVSDEQPVITLPLVLTGTYTLVFADGDGRCYYAEIEL